jgi:hypothetical protein
VPSGVKASAHTGPSWPVSRWRWVAVAVSQRRTLASAPAEARAVPSGVKASAHTGPSWPVSRWRWVAVAVSQRRTAGVGAGGGQGGAVRGEGQRPHRPVVAGEPVALGGGGGCPRGGRRRRRPAEARAVPSGVKASANTGPSWPVSRWRWVAVAVSQRRTAASAPAEARAVPSGVKASANTGPSWPVSRWRWVAVAVSQRRTAASSPAEARAVPSGVKASAHTGPVVAGEPVALGGGGGVPEADGGVGAGGGQGGAVRGEGQRPHRPVVAGEPVRWVAVAVSQRRTRRRRRRRPGRCRPG